MGIVRSNLSVSVDGYVAGPDQSLDEPLGVGGERLHEWMFATQRWHSMQGDDGGEPGPDSEMVARMHRGVGAFVMGRNMFSAGRGDWDPDWRGWWGADPPYHAPVFVATHHPREPLPMAGGTTFHFVTDGVEAAVAAARRAAGDSDVLVAGGASTVNQALAAGLLDELFLHVSPVVLGSGERLFAGVGDPRLTPVEVVGSPTVTHVRYRVRR
ncbi:dihydrofolate reductase family protein [Actinocatenispora sera]|uniref:DNA-binding protein n=1 Tax=Actinocatenispora sera TaxID=390989 RepID=A0A810L2V2_9ACTN|nr:dihydrofolate reductase family protein [Actinocatenispora sera]BCJ28952.1 DNA-binding protein [Actinocatenispora sera]